MKRLLKAREARGISQRNLAKQSGLSFRSIQLLESGSHDPKISTLEKVAVSFGYSPEVVANSIRSLFETPPDAVINISERIVQEGESSWKGWLFNFVDAFRASPKKEYIELSPINESSQKIKALLAATVETLCEEQQVPIPWWCDAMPVLPEPWFVSGMESLKPMALIESPIHFRKRNIFVLENFLERR